MGQSSLLRSSLDLFSFSLNTALPFSPSPAPQVRQRWYDMIEFNGKEFDGRRTHHLMAVSTLGGDILIALPILVAETKHFIRNWETGVLPRVDFFPQLEGSICQNGAKMVPKSFKNGFFSPKRKTCAASTFADTSPSEIFRNVDNFARNSR